MKKKTALTVYIVLFAITFSVVGVLLIAAKISLNKAKAVDNVKTTYEPKAAVDAVSGISEDMLSYEYWTKLNEANNENAGKELFTRREIELINENNPSFVQYSFDGGVNKRKLYMNDLPDTVDGRIVEALMEPEGITDFASENPEFYVNGTLTDQDYLDGLYDNMAFDEIPDEVTPIYAINLNRTVSKIFPTEDFAADTKEEIYFDSFISAEIMPFEGVVVLHESRDKQFAYVLDGSFLGWVRKENLAFCSNKTEWEACCNPKEFLVVTGSEVVLDETAYKTASSGMVLPMGTKLSLSKEDTKEVNGKRTYGCYVVDVPAKGDDGELIFEKALLPISKDVSVGYLPMTSDLVLSQAFKFLGRVYGYGGSLSSNDCSGFVRQVYACFGMELPRNAKAIAKMSDLGSVDTSNMTVDAKKNLLQKTQPGLPVFMEGHLMLYLGMGGGEPYVISSCATFIEPGDESLEVVDAYCVFVSGMDLLRKNGNTWLEDMSYVLNRSY